MKKFIAILLGSLRVSNCFAIPQIPAINLLSDAYSISDVKGIEYIAHFPEYKDYECYGKKPNCFDQSSLESLNSTIDWNDPHSYQIMSKKNLYIAKIHDAFIAPPYTGTIFNNAQQLLFEIYVRPGNPLFMPVSPQINNYKIITLDKIATVQGPSYYYHWVVDRLPSILLMKDLIINNPDIPLIINVGSWKPPSYVHKYLDLLGIPRNQQIVAEAETLYYAQTVIFATPFLMEPIPKKLLLALRSQLLQEAYKQKPSVTYRDNLIVIIQRKELNRRIDNLPELINLIKKLYSSDNYEIVIFDASMKLSEQIQVFNKAKLIIGVMASGLTNILYATPGTTIIEIHPTYEYLLNLEGVNNSGNEWCWWLSSAVGLDYWFVQTPFDMQSSIVIAPIDQIANILNQVKKIQDV